MIDVSTITTALSGLKTAADIAKALRDADVTLEKAEMKYKLAELIEALAEAKMSIADFRELLEVKEEEIRKLKEKSALEFRNNVYFRNGDDTPFCPFCLEERNREIHFNSPTKRSEGIFRSCNACGVTYIKRGNSEEYKHWSGPTINRKT